MYDYQNLPKLLSPEKIFNLDQSVILIIGGAGKMGQNFAEVLSNAKAQVYLLDINEKLCHEAAERISKKTKNSVTSIRCDVSKSEEVLTTFNQILTKTGRIDVLIYNVYSKPNGYYRRLDDYKVKTWEQVMRVNVTGAFTCCQQAINIFKKEKKSGNIILTLSTYGLVGPDLSIYDGLKSKTNLYGGEYPLTTPLCYSVSKSGLLGMVKYLASTCGKHNIRVNGLSPGGVYDGQEESFHDAYVNKVPLGRMATWSDYNGAILFLASDASRYMTGANLVVDGGWSTW